jgi:hypothetical protein
MSGYEIYVILLLVVVGIIMVVAAYVDMRRGREIQRVLVRRRRTDPRDRRR